MLNQKKRNEQPPQDDDNEQAPPVLRVLPPLRTWVVRSEGFDSVEGDVIIERTIHAHAMGVDELGALSFLVVFWGDPQQTQPVQATKLVLNAGTWLEVEEINLAFPEMVTH